MERINILKGEVDEVLEDCYGEINSETQPQGVKKMYGIIGYLSAIIKETLDIISGEDDECGEDIGGGDDGDAVEGASDEGSVSQDVGDSDGERGEEDKVSS
jgi:hypothetical protein